MGIWVSTYYDDLGELISSDIDLGDSGVENLLDEIDAIGYGDEIIEMLEAKFKDDTVEGYKIARFIRENKDELIRRFDVDVEEGEDW